MIENSHIYLLPSTVFAYDSFRREASQTAVSYNAFCEWLSRGRPRRWRVVDKSVGGPKGRSSDADLRPLGSMQARIGGL